MESPRFSNGSTASTREAPPGAAPPLVQGVPPGEQHAEAEQEAGDEGDREDGHRAGGGCRPSAGVPAAAGALGRVTRWSRPLAPVSFRGTWSARANSAAVANRSAATGASARWMAWSTASGTLGRVRRTLGGGSLRRRAIIAWAVGAANGASPASIS